MTSCSIMSQLTRQVLDDVPDLISSEELGHDVLESHGYKFEATFERRTMTEVSLPPELTALSVFKMCKYAVEVYSSGPFFKLESTGSEVMCSVSCFEMARRVRTRHFITYVSAVDVYETYGLDIAYSFLRAIRTSNSESTSAHRVLVMAYLISSLSILDEGMATLLIRTMDELLQLHVIANCCNMLFDKMIELEEKKAKLAHPLETTNECPLPTELLAMVFQSVRVNHSTRSSWLQIRSQERRTNGLRQGELEARSRDCGVSIIDERFWLSEGSVRFAKEEDAYSLHIDEYLHSGRGVYREDDEQPTFTEVALWTEYARVAGRPKREVFLEATAELDLNDCSTLCTWILLLAKRSGYELLRGKSKTTKLYHSDLLACYTELRDTYLLS